MSTRLCPVQQRALDQLLHGLAPGSLFVLHGGVGSGKTTILAEAHRAWGGAFLAARDFMERHCGQHPLALEETFHQMVRDALAAQPAVIVDDLHFLRRVVGGGCSFYPRNGLLDMPLTALAAQASAGGRRLLFGSTGSVPAPVHQRCQYVGIAEFEVPDYEALAHVLLGERVAGLDFRKIHRFAPKLNAHQLRATCEHLRHRGQVETAAFIEYLRSQRMVSNVDLGEVQAVDLRDLHGVDDVLRSLEANIILPLEDDVLAAELDIQPKRGVLLAGPPGTGKTTIGRALAHRLKSKFFLVDGTIISGTRDFYQRIGEVFQAATQNAPAIIFIDDSDVIFESGEEMGLYRYLLTMLDGLESESAARVCVMMTAMDVGSLPPALVRSGRIELWLETALPDEAARAAILRDHLARLPASIGPVDAGQLVAATEGFTGADLKRLVEDGKVLLAYDRSRNLPEQPATDYFLAAVETVRANKERYAEAEARARSQRPQRPPWFQMYAGSFADGEDEE